MRKIFCLLVFLSANLFADSLFDKERFEKIYNSNFDFFTTLEMGTVKEIKEAIDNNQDMESLGLGLSIASFKERVDVAKLLLQAKAPIDDKTYGYTPLIFAIFKENADLVKILIKAGSDVNYVFNNSETPLAIAVLKNNPTIVALLVDAGAKVWSDNDGQAVPLLIQAICNSKMDVVSILARAKAQFNEIALRKDNLGLALIMSVYLQHASVVKLLIDCGADVNFQNQKSTVLGFAVESRNMAIAKILIDAKADVNMTDRHGITPLMIAEKNQDLNMRRLLIDAGAYK